MGQEYFIKSNSLQDKVNQLLPSQGGLGAGQDLSASTTIIPIVDLTESAEGSEVRQDLQTSFSYDNTNVFNAQGSTDTIANSTGYWRIKGYISVNTLSTVNKSGRFDFSNGVATKKLFEFNNLTVGVDVAEIIPFDFTVFLSAGDSISATTTGAAVVINGSARQIADINGNLISPT